MRTEEQSEELESSPLSESGDEEDREIIDQEDEESEDEEGRESDLETARRRAARRRKIKRESGHKPTLEDLQLVGDLLFAERPTVGYSGLEQKELIALGDVSELNAEGRASVFEKGLHFEKKGKPGLALQCYLACIQGLDGHVGLFAELPLCLRHIARLYFAEEDYEKAVHFVQAEKLYYETALLATEEPEDGGSESARDEEDAPSRPDDLRKMMIARAQEFELLADMCLHSKNIGLALDYIGKAAKISEAVYGKDDERSNQAYEKFSYIYAEAGKIQYNDALQRFQRRQSQLSAPKEIVQEEVYTPEQSLGQKIFSLLLLFLFFIIIVVEILLVVLSFSKGYLYIPSSREITNALHYIWLKGTGR